MIQRKIAVIFLALIWSAVVPARADEPKAPTLRGELRDVDGIRVLRVWGTPTERGFAHGYLLAEDIVRLLDGYLRETESGRGPSAYVQSLRRLPLLMKLLQKYEEELRGMAEGIRARLGEKARLSFLQREIGYDDLFAMNCIPDTSQMGCSSFAVWGPMTKTGGTVAGRNLDWHRIKSLRGAGIVVAFLGDAKSAERGWISVTWPGFIGCLTGMNAQGVTVAMHDVFAGKPSAAAGFTPRGFILREAIESAGMQNPAQAVQRVLQSRRSAVGNNVPVSWPHPGKGVVPGATVFEYDGDLQKSAGVTARTVSIGSAKSEHKVDAGGCFQVCTNHFCRRSAPGTCERFDKMQNRLAGWPAGKVFTTDDAWSLLRDVACGEGPLETYQSVVFEPDLHRMHVAFSAVGKAAAFNKPVTLESSALLAPPG